MVTTGNPQKPGWACVLLLWGWTVPVCPELRVEIVTLGVMDVRAGASSLTYHGAAIDTAVDKLRDTYGDVFNVTHTYVYDKQITNCVEITYHSDYLLSEWYYRKTNRADLYAFISPTCLDEISINRLTASWNLLMFTTVASDGSSRNKLISPTRVTMGAVSVSNYAQLVYDVMVYYGWINLYVILDENSLTVYPVILSVFQAFMKRVRNAQVTTLRINTKATPNYKRILEEFSTISRVLIFLGNGSPVRSLMIHAALLNMTNEEFVYVACEYYKAFGTFTWRFQDSDDNIARAAFRSLLLLTLDSSDDNTVPKDLLSQWTERSLVNYNYTFRASAVPMPAVIATYNAFAIFGQVLNETIFTNPTFDLRDGKAFAGLFFNRTFFGLNCSTIYMDAVGERVTTLVVNDLNNQSGLFEPALHQDPVNRQLREIAVVDWGGVVLTPPLNEPVCGYRNNKEICAKRENVGAVYAIAFGMALVLLALTSAAIFYFIRKAWLSDVANGDRWWSLDYTELIFASAVEQRTKGFYMSTSTGIERNTKQSGIAQYRNEDVWVEVYNGTDVRVIVFDKQHVSKQVNVLLKQLRTILHKNVNNLQGICISLEPNPLLLIVSSFCQRGSLHDLFDRFVRFESEQCKSLAMDVLKGMRFIHTSAFGVHGYLTGWKCLIDHHFTLRIAQLGFNRLKHELLKETTHTLPSKIDESRFYWTAPEILRNEAEVSKKTDVYSVGIILYEIMTVSTPYKIFAANNSEGVVQKIMFGEVPPLRPDVDIEPHPVPDAIRDVIVQCWSEDPENRPTVQQALERFDRATSRNRAGRKNLVDNLLSRLDAFAEGLEIEVRIRTDALLVERRNCDDLLCEMLPRLIVEKLRSGDSVTAEMFDSVTIMFSDIYGFNEMTAEYSPLEVTDLLNRLYSVFDPVLLQFDVYKVETIGNVYMVASGVPVRNGNLHVRETCMVALTLRLDFVLISKISNIYFRAGIHTGPCAAGVMGLKNPRYCLFGDTVNTASRMNSHSAPSKIHLSSTTADFVRRLPGFQLTERGQMEIKGKGIQTTFWLNS